MEEEDYQKIKSTYIYLPRLNLWTCVDSKTSYEGNVIHSSCPYHVNKEVLGVPLLGETFTKLLLFLSHAVETVISVAESYSLVATVSSCDCKPRNSDKTFKNGFTHSTGHIGRMDRNLNLLCANFSSFFSRLFRCTWNCLNSSHPRPVCRPPHALNLSSSFLPCLLKIAMPCQSCQLGILITSSVSSFNDSFPSNLSNERVHWELS